jgi:hypothetical protein
MHIRSPKPSQSFLATDLVGGFQNFISLPHLSWGTSGNPDPVSSVGYGLRVDNGTGRNIDLRTTISSYGCAPYYHLFLKRK